MKKPEQVAADLLDLSFTDINDSYTGLTTSERQRCTKVEFEALLKWIKEHQTKP